MAMLELLQVARPEAQVAAPVANKFTTMKESAVNWLARDRDPMSTISPAKWSERLRVDRGVLEYLFYIGDTGKLDHNFDSFRHRRMDELMNYQIPRLLQNAGLITQARAKGNLIAPPGEKFFASKAGEILNPPVAPPLTVKK